MLDCNTAGWFTYRNFLSSSVLAPNSGRSDPLQPSPHIPSTSGIMGSGTWAIDRPDLEVRYGFGLARS